MLFLDELEKQYQREEGLFRIDEVLISSFVCNIRKLLMLDYEVPDYTKDDMLNLYHKSRRKLDKIFDDMKVEDKEKKLDDFFSFLPEIRRTLNTSIQAILEGDPASDSKQEIVIEYPGFEAILYYRVAHEFYMMGLKTLARYISEMAHHHTGIDINPGATIGDYFFIDHGTGIVIGETAILGNHIKLYQGVTLGALSLRKGRDLIGKKRHPTVEDNVTIYSNAAIFGGETVIGHGSTIGGDVYLTHSVEPNSIVLQTDKDLTILKKDA